MISICIPTMDRPQKLFEAVCSILLQGEDNLELVLKDNGTIPCTEDPRVEKVLELFPGRVDYRRDEPLSLFRSANDCLARARGDLFYFMGDDDMLSPGALRAVRERFEVERFREPFWLHGLTVSADDSGKALGIDGSLTSYGQMLEHNRIGGPSVFWSRGIAAISGNFDTRYRYAADYDLWLRMWRIREPAFLDQPLGIYRHHPGQTSVSRRDELEREARAISSRHRYLADAIGAARAVQMSRKAYGGDFPPER